MQIVSVPCHPLSLAVLRTHYGADTIYLANHDPIFDLLTGSRKRHAPSMPKDFTASVSFVLKDSVAAHISQHAVDIGRRLYRHHKHLLCWYVVAQVRMKGSEGAKPAVSDWLSLHGVDEDAYSIETAYKLVQRFGWDFDKKNPHFSKQIRRKTAEVLHRKMNVRAKTVEVLNPAQMRMKDVEIQLIVARFLTSYCDCYKRVPVCLPKHTAIYIYKVVQGYTEREVAQKLNLKHAGVHHALVSMRNRIQKNPTIARLMEEARALPQK